MSNELNIDQNDKDIELEKLCTDSVELIHYARNVIVKHVNIVQIMTYYSLGRWIVETQQMGQKRAKYGSKVIKILSEKLQEEFGKGFSEDTLKNARKFYLTYKERISETVFSLFAIEKSETVFSLFEKEPPFIVSWSHYLQLMRIENEDERSFYEIESAKSGWAVRTLQRQYNSSLYERLALSRDKNGVLRLAKEGNVIEKPEDIIKQPTVLEFLGMEEKAKYSETDLETALINKLQKFLLELGKGYLFEARQKRFTYDEENFYVDLVFYNRLLRCYVLIWINYMLQSRLRKEFEIGKEYQRMIKKITRDPMFLAQKSVDATEADKQVITDLLDTLRANLDHCVGMAANMIGVSKNIIVVAAGPFQFAMINPVIAKKTGAFQTEEGCLSLDGVRPCTRYKEIEVDYLDTNFKKQHGKYIGWTAQIIQHEVDHCNGIVI